MKTAEEYLEKIGIIDIIVNKEGWPEDYKRISEIMEEYARQSSPWVSVDGNGSDYTKHRGFWERLKSFVSDVQVNDMMGEEEKEMILYNCEQKLKPTH